MEENSIKNLEIGIKGMHAGLSLELDSKRHFYFVKYLHPYRKEQIDVGAINSSSREFRRFSNGNVPEDTVDSLEKYLLRNGYRVSSSFNSGIGDE